MHSKEESEKHFKKINFLKSKIASKKGKIGGVTKNTESDLYNLFNEYSSAIQEKKKEILGGFATYLENNELPSDILFHALGPKKYSNITHNKTSPYSKMYYGEIQMLLDLVDNKSKYINKNIIDIGCGDGIKLYAMLQEAIKNKKIEGTVDYLGLDDSIDMLNFAKDNFYNMFYSKTKNKKGFRYIQSDDIDPINKKIRPWFQKSRFQNINGLDKKTPKTMFFLGGTFGNLGNFQEEFLKDINKMLQKDDTFVLSYFRVLDRSKFGNLAGDELIKNFFEREKKRYEDHNVVYHEKEIDIRYFKNILPGIDIKQEDFDINMELDSENKILYDVRISNRDIIYNGEIVMQKGVPYRSEGTKIDEQTLRENLKKENFTKNFVESLYRTKETHDFINEFLVFRGVDPKDCSIHIEYEDKDNTLYISLEPLKPITFFWEEDGIKKTVTKKPGDVIVLHKSKRFSDSEMKDIIKKAGLTIVDELGCKGDIANQDIMKLLVIKKQ
ncbi:hypothetical protein P148_SR1C00001G1071 [candidate division SR1 bacterium RAAC1_SR1_1]|nr:hypothetical protein P148_SR1C00001G1071 [candidate division SR1 bacterium RAAC1_SR1_1]